MTDLKPCECCGGLGVHTRHLTPMEAAAGAMLEALTKLANAADNVGCAYFDTDDMPEVVTEMQEATLAARAAITLATGTAE